MIPSDKYENPTPKRKSGSPSQSDMRISLFLPRIFLNPSYVLRVYVSVARIICILAGGIRCHSFLVFEVFFVKALVFERFFECRKVFSKATFEEFVCWRIHHA